jgi:hypothetical protein
MSTTYPGVKQLFTDPSGTSLLTSPDHAGLHTNINDTVEAIQDTVGTTAGTNVLKNFAAGNFPARINTSNVLQQAIQGTINTSTLGTPAITGGTLGTATITGGTIASSVINNATLGSPAITGGTQTLPNIVTRTIGSAVYTGTVSTTQTLNLASATRHLVNMANSAGSVTLAVSNVTANEPFVVEIKQGTAGLGTVNWFSGISWSGSVSPTQTLTASRKDTFGFIATSGTSFDGYIVGQNL